jgi:hypothetical protein
MQEKHKVTLYIPPELHRQLKIKSAIELEPMSAIAERAIVFYLEHSDIVDEVEHVQGQSHRIYSCPTCTTSVVLKEGEMVAVNQHSALIADDEVAGVVLSQDEQLVPC